MGKPAATDRPRLTSLSHSFTLDFVVTFQFRKDANLFRQQVRQRFAEFGLELAEEKTRRILFGRFAAITCLRHGYGRPETLEFPGYVFSPLMWWKASGWLPNWLDASLERNIGFCAQLCRHSDFKNSITSVSLRRCLWHLEWSKVVYCKDSNRTESCPHVHFTFLGFTFRPRKAISRPKRGLPTSCRV
jgi:hypothetical protein